MGTMPTATVRAIRPRTPTMGTGRASSAAQTMIVSIGDRLRGGQRRGDGVVFFQPAADRDEARFDAHRKRNEWLACGRWRSMAFPDAGSRVTRTDTLYDG